MSQVKTKKSWKKKIFTILLGSLCAVTIVAAVVYYMAGPGFLMMLRLLDYKSNATGFQTQEVTIATAREPIRTRIYMPLGGKPHRTIVAVHGIHYDGYNEGRLRMFSGKLAEMGVAIVTPEIVDLKNYRITTRALDDLEDVAKWTLQQNDLVTGGDGKIGFMGFSFCGGLGLSVASRASLRDHIAFVFSFGGHGDIDRTMEYLVTGKLPEGGYQDPHIYAVAVVLYKYLEHLVSAQELPLMRECLLDYLHEQEAKTRAKMGPLSAPAQHLLELCIQRKSAELGALVAPHVRAFPCDPALSPVRQTPPPCRIFLLHGAVDAVIPPSESKRLYEWASPAGEAHLLISPLIVHVEWEAKNSSDWRDTWRLAVFLTRFLRS